MTEKYAFRFLRKITDLSTEIRLCEKRMDILAKIVTMNEFSRFRVVFMTDSGETRHVGEKNDKGQRQMLQKVCVMTGQYAGQYVEPKKTGKIFNFFNFF